MTHDSFNLWMMDVPFKLDSITNLPRYVAQNTYQTILDDKSGYDHFALNRTEQGVLWYPIGRLDLFMQHFTVGYTILQVSWPQISSAPLASPALFT